MDKFTEFMQAKVGPTAMKLSGSDVVTVVGRAFSMIMGVIIGGAFFTLINSFNVGPFQAFLESIGIKPFLSVVELFTSGLMGLYVAFSVGYSYMQVKGLKDQAIGAGLCSIIAFLIVTPVATIEDVRYLAFDFLGSAGIFTAIIMGFIVGAIYQFCIKRDVKITMPDGTPPNISESFAAVIPSLIAIGVAVALNMLCSIALGSSPTEFIYSLLKAPFEGFSSSIFTFVLFSSLISFFWLFGIHGGQIFTPFILMLYLQNGIENQAAYAAGEPLPHILTFSFFLLTLIGGNGGTLGLSLDMLLFSKSERYKTLGKLAIAPSICGINEPLLFGMPIVMNLYMAVPFILVPIVNILVAFGGMSLGLISYPRIATSVLGTPVLLDGFLICGVSGVILQLVLIAISAVIYFPFFKALDTQACQEENEAE